MDDNPHTTDEHPLSEKQGNTDDKKFSTTVAAFTDPKFPLPVLDSKSSPVRYVLSFATLFALLGGGIVGAWMLDVAILQSTQPVVVLGCAFALVLGCLFFVGTVWVDWFELVFGYWWLSMPVGAAAALVLVLNEKSRTGIEEST